MCKRRINLFPFIMTTIKIIRIYYFSLLVDSGFVKNDILINIVSHALHNLFSFNESDIIV